MCAPGLDALGLDQSQASTNQIPRSSSAVPSVQVDPLELAGADQYILASQYNDTDQEFSELEIPDTYAESSSVPVLPTRRRPRVANPRSSDDDSLPRARPRVEVDDSFVVPDGSSFVEYESERVASGVSVSLGLKDRSFGADLRGVCELGTWKNLLACLLLLKLQMWP